VALSFDTIQMVNLNTSSEFCFQGLLSPIALTRDPVIKLLHAKSFRISRKV